jgi:hypothetical protein
MPHPIRRRATPGAASRTHSINRPTAPFYSATAEAEEAHKEAIVIAIVDPVDKGMLTLRGCGHSLAPVVVVSCHFETSILSLPSYHSATAASSLSLGD